jgi:hypothetical protein
MTARQLPIRILRGRFGLAIGWAAAVPMHAQRDHRYCSDLQHPQFRSPTRRNYHLSELQFSAHQTRLSLLGQGKVDPDTALAAYVESHFLSAPTDANSIETNSYEMR